MYMKLQNYLYGYIRVALLFCKKLSHYLEAMGFIINPYNPCVENKIFNGIIHCGVARGLPEVIT